MTLLETGSEQDHRNFVPPDAFLAASEREAESEQITIELADAFWSLPAGETYAAAAQIVYTLSTLEGGKEVLLLDGTVPGEVVDGSFEPMEQPLTRAHFDDVAPWIEIVQPVAGSVVGHTLLISVRSRSDRLLAVITGPGGASIAQRRIKAGGAEQIELPNATEGPVSLSITTTGPDPGHEVILPLVVAPGS